MREAQLELFRRLTRDDVPASDRQIRAWWKLQDTDRLKVLESADPWLEIKRAIESTSMREGGISNGS